MVQQIDNFIKNNSYLATTIKKEKTKNYFFVEQRTLPKQSLILGLLAQLVHETKFLRPIGIYTLPLESSNKIFQFFGITKKVNVSLRKSYLNFSTLILSVTISCFDIIKFILNGKSFKGFISDYTIENIHCGDLIFDKFVRSKNRFLNPEKKLFMLLTELVRAQYLTRIQIKTFNKYKPKLVIVSTRAYASSGGIMSRIALYRNIPTWVISPNYMYKRYKYEEAFIGDYCYSLEDFQKDFPKDWSETVDTYLKQRFSGNINHHDVEFAFGKEQLGADNLKKQLGINTELPVVVIFAHAFSDANNYSGEMLFNSYYDWLLNTLKFIKGNKSCSWILKPHPSAELYHEDIEIYNKLISDLELSNDLYLLKEKINTKSILDLASVVITCRGTVILESTALGIPCITAGRPDFGEFGINHRAKSINEYKNYLAKITDIEKPSLNQIELAKRIIYKHKIIDSQYKSEIIPAFDLVPNSSREEIDKSFEEVFKKLNENLANYNLKSDPFYAKLIEFSAKL